MNTKHISTAPIIATEKPHILLAEDMPVNRYVLQEMLEQLGYDVSSVVDGEEVISTLAANQGNYDLVLMDCRMPKIDGFKATGIIRSHIWGKKLPIIAMTAQALVGDRQKCLEAGMDDYLSKPVRLMEIARMVGKYVMRSPVPVAI